jgi:hypothetical protein
MSYRIKSPDGKIFETKKEAIQTCGFNKSVIDYLLATPSSGWTLVERPRKASEFHDRPGGPVASQVYNLKIEVQTLQNQLQAYQVENKELLNLILAALTQPTR